MKEPEIEYIKRRNDFLPDFIQQLDDQFYKSFFFYLAGWYYPMKPKIKEEKSEFRLSDLCGSLPTISEEDIDKRIKSIREEWERDI